MPAVWEEALGLQLLVLGSAKAPGSSSPSLGGPEDNCFFSLGVRNA